MQHVNKHENMYIVHGQNMHLQKLIRYIHDARRSKNKI